MKVSKWFFCKKTFTDKTVTLKDLCPKFMFVSTHVHKLSFSTGLLAVSSEIRCNQ